METPRERRCPNSSTLITLPSSYNGGRPCTFRRSLNVFLVVYQLFALRPSITDVPSLVLRPLRSGTDGAFIYTEHDCLSRHQYRRVVREGTEKWKAGGEGPTVTTGDSFHSLWISETRLPWVGGGTYPVSFQDRVYIPFFHPHFLFNGQQRLLLMSLRLYF
jgi:hypothetical protein